MSNPKVMQEVHSFIY